MLESFLSLCSCLKWSQLFHSYGENISWPLGLVGSVTHKNEFISVALAKSNDAVEIGIDSEEIVQKKQALAIERKISTERELKNLRDKGMPFSLALSLIFSAKESIFKCLFSLTGEFFRPKNIELRFLISSTNRFKRGQFSIKISHFDFKGRSSSLIFKIKELERRGRGEFEIKNNFVHTSFFF